MRTQKAVCWELIIKGFEDLTDNQKNDVLNRIIREIQEYGIKEKSEGVIGI
jgi:hypothetical protein